MNQFPPATTDELGMQLRQISIVHALELIRITGHDTKTNELIDYAEQIVEYIKQGKQNV